MEHLLRLLLRTRSHTDAMTPDPNRPRPDLVAANRGEDASSGMEGEADFDTASLDVALMWQQTYQEILTMEESVLVRINELMARQTPAVQREVALTNVPVVESQVKRFRDRLGFWDTKVRELRLSAE